MDVEKLYVSEIRPHGEVSTVGLFYSREEAEEVVRQLAGLPEKGGCRYQVSERPLSPVPPPARRP